MFTKEQIDEIITELGLDLNDSSVRKTIEQILASKPSVNIDQNFIASLREDLAERAQHYEAQTASSFTKTNINFFSSFMNKVLAGALAVMVLVAGGGLWYIQQTNKLLFTNNGLGVGQQLLSSEFAVKEATPESFGDLSKVTIANAKTDSNLKAITNGTSQGGAPAMADMPTSTMPSEGGGQDEKLIAPGEIYPGAIQYSFKYTGAEFPQLPDTQGVLKKVKPNQPSVIVSQIIKFLSFGLVDLNKLTNTNLSYVTFTEDKEFGYQTNIDLEQGNVYMYPNYNKWPQDYNCGMAGCGNYKPLQASDVMPDQDAITLADKFIADYGISKEGYGAPEINNTWRIMYANAPAVERASFYIPEQIQIVYPLILDGKKVYDEGGGVYGLNVYIDARSKRVVSVSDIVTKQFERSSYQGVTDKGQILKVAQKGGFRNYTYEDANAKTVKLELDTPTVQTVKMWYSNDNYNNSTELYVPALVFPVKNWKESNYWRQNVYVPLVQDILNSENQSNPVPIPLDAKPIDATTQSTSASAGVETKN